MTWLDRMELVVAHAHAHAGQRLADRDEAKLAALWRLFLGPPTKRAEDGGHSVGP